VKFLILTYSNKHMFKKLPFPSKTICVKVCVHMYY
jgi:hypothetical protein